MAISKDIFSPLISTWMPSFVHQAKILRWFMQTNFAISRTFFSPMRNWKLRANIEKEPVLCGLNGKCKKFNYSIFSYVGHRSNRRQNKGKGRISSYAIYKFNLIQEKMAMDELVLYQKVNIDGNSVKISWYICF